MRVRTGFMGFRKKYSKLGRRYDLIGDPLERFFGPLRKKAAEYAHGRVLEIGVGTGFMLPYYSRDIELHAIDAVPEMLNVAKERAEKLGLNAHFHIMDVENLGFPDESFDTVVSAFVFCTVPHPERAMVEIHRVLKPNGRAIFLEHTKSDCQLLNWLFLKPLDFLLGWLLEDNTLRETHSLVGKHFEIEYEETRYRGIVRLIVARKTGTE